MKRVTERYRRRRVGRDAGERGVAAVELALVLPLVGLLLAGTVDIGLLVRDHQALQNAAREAARFSAMPYNRLDMAASPDAVRAGIENLVIAYLANEGIVVAGGDIAIDQNVTMTVDGLTVEGSRVDIRYNKSMLFGVLANMGFADPFALTGSALFRNFY
jgi:Flp pilus assembly protein TadG